MNFDVLNFYIGTFNKAQKNGTLNEETLLRLNQLYLLGDIEDDVYLVLTDILNKCLKKNDVKQVAVTAKKVKKNTSLRPATIEEAKSFLEGKDVFIIQDDGCHMGYKPATPKHVCNPQIKLYLGIEKEINPCSGCQMEYKEIKFSEPVVQKTGSCEGSNNRGIC